MALSDDIKKLDDAVARRVERTLRDAKEDLARRLRRVHEELLASLENLEERASPQPPEGGYVAREDFSALLADAERAVEPGPQAGPEGGPLGRLRRVVTGLDRARTQRELLEALVRGVTTAGPGAAERAAVFLLRGDRARLYASHGFGETDGGTAEVELGVGETEGWRRAARGSVVALGGGERAGLGNRLEAAVGHEAVVVPLVLRDRVAALLYADRVDETAALDRDALTLATYVSGLALETLPFRERPATPGLADDGEPVELETWPEARPAETEAAAGVEAAPPAVEPERVPEARPVAEAEAEPEPADEAAAEPVPPAPGPTADEAAISEEAGAWTLDEAAPAAGTAPSPGAPAAAKPPVPVEAEPAAPIEAEPPAPGEAEPAETAPPERPEPVEPAAGRRPEAAPVEPPTPRAPEREAPAVAETPTEAEAPGRRAPSPAAPEPEPEFEGDETRPGEEPAAAREPAAAPQPPPAAAGPSEVAPPPEAEQAPAGGARVAPPEDLQGPGAAFSTGPARDRDAGHDEAQRLARLLVSEIKLYNEEQVEEGRRNRDVYTRLKDDIDRSRQIYDGRVDPEVRESKDYFHQELVRVLGGGDESNLGL